MFTKITLYANHSEVFRENMTSGLHSRIGFIESMVHVQSSLLFSCIKK